MGRVSELRVHDLRVPDLPVPNPVADTVSLEVLVWQSCWYLGANDDCGHRSPNNGWDTAGSISA